MTAFQCRGRAPQGAPPEVPRPGRVHRRLRQGGHPTDKWWLGRSRTQRVLHELSGNPARLDVADPVSLEQRRKVAASCQANLFDGVVPLYVDAMDDAVKQTEMLKG